MLGNTAVELAGSDEEIRQFVGAAFRRTEDAFRRALRRAQDAGELAPGDVSDRAALLVVVLQGLQVVARTEADPERLVRAVDAAVRGLLAPATGPRRPLDTRSRRTEHS
jgi:TetR/AcrR family transcriptional repressor of nem operon